MACGSTPLARPPELEQSHDEPNRDDYHCAEQKIGKSRTNGVEAQVQDAACQLFNALDQVEGRDAEHRKDDADHDREQHQSDQSARYTVAEELLPVHAAVSSHSDFAAIPLSTVHGVVTNPKVWRG